MVQKKIVIKPTLEPVLGKEKKKPLTWLRSYYRPFFFVAVPLNLLAICFAGFFWKFLPPLVPLFYTLLETEQQLADKNWIVVLPVMGLIINVIHFWVIYLARKYDQTLLRVFSYMTIFLQLLILAVLLRIILIVI